MRQGHDEPANCKALEWLEATCKALLLASLPRLGLQNVVVILTICGHETAVAVYARMPKVSPAMCLMMEVGGPNDISVWGFPQLRELP